MLSAYIDSMEEALPALAHLKFRINRRRHLGHRPFWVQVTAGTLLLLYVIFCTAYVVRQLRSIRAYLRSQLKTDYSPQHGVRLSIHIRIPTNPAIIIVPYGFYMGMGFAALVPVSFALAAHSPAEVGSLKIALRITLLTAVAGARIFSIFLEDDVSPPPPHYLPPRVLAAWRPIRGRARGRSRTPTRLRSQLEALCSEPHSGLSPLPDILACRMPHLRLLLRTPRHLDAPASARSDYTVTRFVGQPLVPIQLISAALFLLFVGVSLPLAVYVLSQLAGAATLGYHAALRLATQMCRADFRGGSGGTLMSTGKMALTQAAASVLWLAYVCSTGRSTAVPLDLATILSGDRLGTCAMATVVGIVAYGVHIDQIGTWVPRSTGGTSKKNGTANHQESSLNRG
ncbi:hypothetical protein B0H17DRAFT_1204830 [Mycena rosella]|uniref:Uncharacterized protein n=1 Tax=Mycena rosella TaxID=1033263 RepID=A0AAD7D896_MYCRO|nr:hypothetical protein B0H17DRAFT_1204830 [Mycena rosella]